MSRDSIRSEPLATVAGPMVGKAQARGVWRSLRWSLFLLTLALLLLTFNARLGCVDGTVMYELAASLADHGSIAVQSDQWGSRGTDGRYYSKYGPLQSVLAVPLYALGKGIARHAPGGVHPGNITTAAVALFNPFVLGLLAVATMELGRRLGLSLRRSVAAALLLIFGTSVWFYSKTFFSEPLTTLLLVSAWIGAHEARHGDDEDRWLFLSGCALALAAATRLVSLVVLPVFLWYLFAGRGFRARSLALFLLPLALAGVSLGTYNWLRFGAPTKSGYGSEGFSTAPWVGLAGLLVSPRCGLLFYSPLALVGLAGMPVLARTRAREVRMILALALAWLIPSACWWCWWGGGSWGPRLLVPVFPFFVVAALAGIPSWKTLTLPKRTLLLGLLLCNLGIQVSSVVVSTAWWEYGVELRQREQGGDRLWDWRYMPLAWQTRHALEVVRRVGAPLPQRLEEATRDPSRKYSQSGGFTVAGSVLDRADMHIIDAWPFYFALLHLPARLLVAGVLLLLMGGGVGAVGTVLALRQLPVKAPSTS